MQDRREGIISNECGNDPYLYRPDVKKVMDEYSKEWESKYREANQFICDLGKLIGLDGLGYDDMKASIEDFRDAIDEKKKEMCLLIMEFVAHETTGHSFNETKDELEFKYKGEWITKAQLFENFL